MEYSATTSEPASHGPDAVIEAYKRDVDRTLIRENLQRSLEERLEALIRLQRFAEELREAGRSGLKDLEAIAELEAIDEERRRRDTR